MKLVTHPKLPGALLSMSAAEALEIAEVAFHNAGPDEPINLAGEFVAVAQRLPAPAVPAMQSISMPAPETIVSGPSL